MRNVFEMFSIVNEEELRETFKRVSEFRGVIPEKSAQEEEVDTQTWH